MAAMFHARIDATFVETDVNDPWIEPAGRVSGADIHGNDLPRDIGRSPLAQIATAALVFFALFASAAHAMPDGAQISAICQSRSTCTIARSIDAGASPAATPLTVVQVRLGFADRPADEPAGCHAGNERDGGVEYWLLEGTRPPRLVLKLCNDGYGMAGVGEDDVTVGPNRLVQFQSGGSAWRWHTTYTFSLAPWRLLTERDCSYHNAMENTGAVTVLDYLAMVGRSIAKDSPVNDDGIGCPEWPEAASRHFTAMPGPGLLGGYNILTPFAGRNAKGPIVPRGGVIGDCVPAMDTAGTNGFVVHGQPAPAGQAAEIRAIAESFNALVIQVFDPTAAAQPAPVGGSWVKRPHVEIWRGHNGDDLRARLSLADLSQVGIDLDGKAYAGVGRKVPLPAVERWQAADEAGRAVTVLRVSWPDTYALLHGIALVYSQADGGRQARLAASTGIVGNRPLYLPDVVSIPGRDSGPQPGHCEMRDGHLSLVAQ